MVRVPVVFSATQGTGTINGTPTVLTNLDGYAHVTVTAPRVPGDFGVLASVPGSSLLAQFNFTSIPAGVSGLNFSPYLAGQSPDAQRIVSEQQIRERLSVVKDYTKWIRTYGTEDGLDRICAIAKEPAFNLPVAVGAWISNDFAANERQLANLFQAARSCPMDMAVIGSEVLQRGNLTEAQLLGYINRFRTAFPGIPVTTAETPATLLAHPNLISAVDKVMVNLHPFWEGYAIDSAVCAVDFWYQRVRQAAGGKEVIVAETGWPSAGSTVGSAVPRGDYAARYFREFVSWARQNVIQYFYFSAFDEQWRTPVDGAVGANWGVWDASGTMKPDRYAVLAGETGPISCGTPGGSGFPQMELTYVPPFGATTNANLQGRVLHVDPAAHRIAVYIQVGGQWWSKPSASQKTTTINPLGEWSANIVTAPNDQQASVIDAYLIPASYDPPLVSGGQLPPSLRSNSLASQTAVRFPTNIGGRVVDPAGNGIAAVLVTATYSGSQTSWSATTNSTGYYSIGVGSIGAYTVTPSHTRLSFQPQSRTVSVTPPGSADFTGSQAPDAPKPFLPFNGATAIDLLTPLAWTSSIRSAFDDVYFGTVSPPPLVASDRPPFTYFPSSLAANTTYFWKVVARNQYGVAESPVWNFTTAFGSGGPRAPIIISPGSGQVFSGAAVFLQWTQVVSASGYRLIVTDRSGNIVFLGTLSGATSTSTSVPLPDGNYAVQVRTCVSGLSEANCTGATPTLPFSVSRPFPPQPPLITFPPANVTLTNSTYSLTWVAIQGANRYEVQVFDAAANKAELSISSVEASTIFSFHSSTRYEMRVRACSVACGPWSVTVPFAVNLPAIPTAAPTVGSATIASGNQLTASWSTVPNADLFILQVVQPNTGPGGGALTVASVRTAATTYTLTVPAGPAVVIVKGCNGNGCGPDSTPVAINVPGPNSAVPVIGSPISGTIVDGPIVLFSWSRIPGDNGSNTPYRLWALDFTRAQTAFDIQTTQNFWAGYFLTEGNRYDAIAFANINNAGPAAGFQVRGTTSTAPTPAAPRHQSTITQGNITVGWTPVPGATLYEYFVAIQGQPSPIANGVTPGLEVQVPLFALNNTATQYSAIMRACPVGATCRFGSDAGWGPWSGVGPGVTNFTVVP